MIAPNSGIASFLAPDRSKLTVPLVALLSEVTPELAAILRDRRQILECGEKHAYRAFVTRLQNRP